MTPPEEIHNVSRSMFSVARHYGGITYKGAHYTYDSVRDVLVRDDVIRAGIKARKLAAKAEREKPVELQGNFTNF